MKKKVYTRVVAMLTGLAALLLAGGAGYTVAR
jgi:hypothetical protein